MLDSLALQAERLASDVALRVVAVGSEGEWSRYLAGSHGATYVAHENKPLGAKWTAALKKARETNPQAVLVLGSDNVVNDALLLRWVEELRAGAEYVAPLDAYQWNPQQTTLIHWNGYEGQRAGEPIGSGRCFARALLDRIKWKVWKLDANRGLDWSTTQTLADVPHRARLIRMSRGSCRHLGVKIRGAMSPSLHRHASSQSIAPATLLEWYGEIGARLLALT
jgi:hypothetical protein